MTDEKTEGVTDAQAEEIPQLNTQEPTITETKEDATDLVAAHEATESQPEAEKATLPPSVQKRLDRATFIAKSKNEENVALKNQLMQLQQQMQQTQPVAQSKATGLQPPDKHDFSDAADYAEALFEYKEKKQQHYFQHQQQVQQEQSLQNYLSDLDAKHAARLEEAREKYKDLDEVSSVLMQPNFTQHPNFLYLSTVLCSSPKSADLQYYFGNNPKEALTILNMPPLEAAAEMGRLEMKLTMPPTKTPRAPAPPSKVTGQASGDVRLTLEEKRKAAFRRQQGL